MANGVNDLKSLPLADIIGAPVSAIVQAETQAAKAAVEFIEKVGFQKNPDEEPGSALSAGSLRMVEFGYTKPDENGNPAEFVARIPLLALFPIPGMRVKLAKVAFSAKITDVFTETTSEEAEGQAEGSGSIVGEPQVQFRGSVVTSTATSDTTTSSYDLSISLELEEPGMSPGMAKLLNMLDLAISESKKQLPP